MAIILERYNRIINLKFYRKIGLPVEIRCPVRGRKPSIEINGTYGTSGYLKVFNLTVKNLYLDLKGDQYTELEVEAGYEGNTVTFKGTILSLYQEEPGPEGRTIIQCINGDMQHWLDATVNLDYEAGTPLITILSDIGKAISIYRPFTGTKAGTLSLPDRFVSNETARDAINKLVQVFKDKKLAIFVRNNVLCATCLAEDDFINVYTLDYMSAPPQENAGGEEGTYYTTVTAPWEPKLQIGDKLRIPSKVYMRNYVTVGSGNATGTTTIQVTQLSFHFGTTGGTNSMTVQGFLIGSKNG